MCNRHARHKASDITSVLFKECSLVHIFLCRMHNILCAQGLNSSYRSVFRVLSPASLESTEITEIIFSLPGFLIPLNSEGLFNRDQGF